MATGTLTVEVRARFPWWWKPLAKTVVFASRLGIRMPFSEEAFASFIIRRATFQTKQADKWVDIGKPDHQSKA